MFYSWTEKLCMTLIYSNSKNIQYSVILISFYMYRYMYVHVYIFCKMAPETNFFVHNIGENGNSFSFFIILAVLCISYRFTLTIQLALEVTS